MNILINNIIIIFCLVVLILSGIKILRLKRVLILFFGSIYICDGNDKTKFYQKLKLLGKYIIRIIILIFWFSIWIQLDIAMNWESTLDGARWVLCSHAEIRDMNESKVYLILFIIFFGSFLILHIIEYINKKKKK